MVDPIQFRFRLLLGPAVARGPGKADLLAVLAETGSISAAARRMGMSYKKAWYLIEFVVRQVARDIGPDDLGRVGITDLAPASIRTIGRA